MECPKNDPPPDFPAADGCETSVAVAVDRWARHYAEDLRRFLLKRRVIESEIKDICQEVYLRMLRFERTETLQNPLAYLFRVAANVAHDFKLRQARWADVSEGSPEAQQTAPSAEELVEAANRERVILRELSALPPLTRAVIALRYQESLTYSEIAERLGVTRRVVQRAVARGYAQIREALQKDL